eukprot:6188698-Pleurochrysis_carterae.AAC.2
MPRHDSQRARLLFRNPVRGCFAIPCVGVCANGRCAWEHYYARRDAAAHSSALALWLIPHAPDAHVESRDISDFALV